MDRRSRFGPDARKRGNMRSDIQARGANENRAIMGMHGRYGYALRRDAPRPESNGMVHRLDSRNGGEKVRTVLCPGRRRSRLAVANAYDLGSYRATLRTHRVSSH